MALATHVTVSLALRTEIAPYVFKFRVSATSPQAWPSSQGVVFSPHPCPAPAPGGS